MSTLGQALGMAYANQYGAKYDLPIFGAPREEEDENPLSSLDLATKLSQPVGATPAADTGVMPQRPIPTWAQPLANVAETALNYGSAAGWIIAGLRKAENFLKPVEKQELNVWNAPAKAALPAATFARNFFQGASPQQKIVDVAQLGINTTEKIFGLPQQPTLPKLSNFADKSEPGFDAGGAGAITGELAGMIASIAAGTGAVKALELPALARTVSTIPGIGGAIAKVAPWLGAETLGGAAGAGLGNAAHSFGTDARSVIEGKEELGHMIAKTGLQGVAGTMFGGAATPGISLGKKVLGEAAVNVLSGVIPAGYDAMTGRTTWLPQRTPTAEAVAKLNAAKASGDPDAIALAAGEADRTATHTLLGAMNSVAGQALLNGLAGAVLPLGAAGVKKLSGTPKIAPRINPVETPSGAAPVSEAMAPGMAQQAIDDMESVKSFVDKHYNTRAAQADLGMGKSRVEIRQSIINQANENPAIFQVIKDINAGKATTDDFYAAIKREAPTQAPEPVVAQEPIPPPTKEQMEHDSLNNLYVVHRYPSREAVPENMRQYIESSGEGFTRSGKKVDEITFASVRVPQSEWEYLTQQRIERPATAVPNIPVSEDFAGQNPIIETMPLDKNVQPAEVVVPQQQSTPTQNSGRVAVEMPAEPQAREIPAMKQIPADLTPENIGRMTEEELAQHFDIAPPAERIPDVGETMVAEPTPVAQAPVEPPAMKSEYEELMAGDRQTKTKDGVTYTRRAPFVKTEGEALVPTRPDVIVGNPTSVQFLESVVPGHYVFHPAGLSVPSHVNGKVNESYFLENPQGKSGQKGIDYVGNRIKYGSFDPKQMVGKDANAYMSAPKVILPTGEPIQGNTRAEFEQKIYQPENARQAEQYKNEILANAEYYGLDTPEKVAAFKAMKNPTISRVVDVDDVTAQRLAMRHQDEAAWSKSPTDNSILRLSTMEPETEKKALRMIAAGLEGEEGDGKTLLQLLRKEDYRKDIALLLAGPKDQKKYAAYMDNMDNNLGANAIQDDLRNLVFGKDERTIRKFDGLTNKQKDVVNSNLGALLRLHDDPLFKDFKSAVDGLQAYNAAAQKQGKGLENWLKGSNAFGRAHSEDYSEAAQKLMLLMDESPAADVRKMLTEYLDIRKNTSGESMFGEEPIPYSTMFQRAIEKTGEGRLLGLAAPVIGQAAGEAGASFFEDDKEYAGIKGSTIKNALRTLGLAAGMIATVHAMGGGKMLKIVTKRGEEVTVKPLPEGTKIINGFYSPIEKLLRETKQEKNSAAKWLSMIGKGDEAKYTGLRAKLEAMKPNEQVSKADLLAHLDENRIAPVEVVKTDAKKYKRVAADDLPDIEWVEDEVNRKTMSYDGYDAFRYNSPDRTIAIHYDSTKSPKPYWYQIEMDRSDNYNSMHEMMDVLNVDRVNIANDRARARARTKWNRSDLTLGAEFIGKPKEYKERLVILPGDEKHQSSHWRNEPNVLVHTRSSMREMENGKNVLLVEEIQSDWGQDGRDKGFATPPGGFSLKSENGVHTIYGNNGRIVSQMLDLGRAERQLAAFNSNGGGGIPEAPFVTETASTTKLAAKYILQDAVASDADYIAWTTGEMQNKRFNLSQHADSLGYDPDSNELVGFKDDNVAFSREVASGDLPEYIGRELAERILAQPKSELNGYQELRGVEMELGGSGMKSFYGSEKKDDIGLVGKVMESLFGKGTVGLNSDGLRFVEMTPAIRAQAQAGLSLFNIGGALIVPDNDEPIYPGASITNREVRILLGGAAIASLATHPQITGLIRNLKISAPETALRELTKVEPTIPGYVDKKLNPTKFTDADVSALVGKAKADGITDELLAHHLAFTRGEQYSRQHLEESRANLYGNQIDPEAEQAAADYLLKSLTHAHNGSMELPEMSDRLHTLALNTIDGAEGVVGKNEYVQSNAAIKNPAAAHTATITQGREQTLGVPDEDYATVAKSVLDLDDLNQKGTWSDDLYFAATGKDETLQSALTKMDKREQLSLEEVQAWQKYEAEKLVWDDAIAKGTNENEWSGIEAIRTKFRDPVRADAFDRYVSTKAWETQMDSEVNAVAKENGFDPIPPPRVKSQALYSSVFPIVPGTWAAVKKSRLGQVALSSAFGYVASNAIFEDDKMYGGMTGKEAKLLMTATFGGMVGAAHISSYFFTKHAPIWMRTAVNNAMHPVDTVALHDVENVAAKKYGRGTEKFNQAVTELQAKLARVDKGIGKVKKLISASWLGDIGHEEYAKINDAQVKAQNTGRLQKREIDLLHDKYKAFSSADKQTVNAAAAAYDWELGLIRANKNLDAVGKDEAVKRVQAALEATWFKDKPTAKQAFDLYHEMAKHARQIDVESRLMKKFGLKWDQLPEKIKASRTLVEVQKDKVRELQQLYAMAEDPASKTAIRKDIHINNKIRENHETFATQLEYMRDLPAESQKYHYLPHYWDKNGAFKYAIKEEGGEPEFKKFDTKAAADKWLKQFRADAAAGLHKKTAARVATSNFVKGQRDIRLTINDLVSAAYSEKTATLARLGLNREALFKALETLDEWTDLPLESRIKVYETLEDNITPESLRHILNEMWAPKDVHLEFRQMRKGYLDVDPKKQLDGTISKQEQRQLHDWVFGGLDKMITGGRLTLEKSAMLHEASNQLDQLGKEGLSSSRYYSWLKDEFIPSLTNQDPIPASRARKIGNVRSAMSMAKLVANPLHGASNIIYGSLATFAEAGIAHKGNVVKAAWYMMTSALDLPTGGKYSSPEMQQGIKLLEKHDYGETQFYNQALRSELGNNELVRKMMFSSVKSEEFNNKMSSIVFMKTALNKGATVEEAVEYALKMRQRTQFAFTPWMTTGAERYIRKSFGGSGSVMLTLMGAAIRGAEHTLSVYSRAAANPKTAFVPAMAMWTAATMISGLYGDPWVATGMRTIELADELLADDDDTRLTNESFLEKCQRRVGDVAEKYGLPREKGENLWNTILQGVPARTTNINMSLDNNLSGMLSPVALSTATQIIKAGGAIISDQSWQEKMLNITKPVTVLARTARAGLSLAEGHRVDNKGNPTTDKPYGMADAFKEITTGTPADVAFAQRAKAAGGGDLQDQFSKEGYVKSMYNMPMLKVGNEKNPEQRQILTEKAPVIRRVIQSNYEKSSDARSKDLEDAIAWARANKPFMNWIDRNGGADILGNVAQKAAPALARNIENWYAAQAAADAVNTTVGPIAKFSPKKLAVEDAITRLQKTAAEKANTPEKKAELRKLFIGLQQAKK